MSCWRTAAGASAPRYEEGARGKGGADMGFWQSTLLLQQERLKHTEAVPACVSRTVKQRSKRSSRERRSEGCVRTQIAHPRCVPVLLAHALLVPTPALLPAPGVCRCTGPSASP